MEVKLTLADFVSRCRALLIESMRLADETSNTLAWIRVFETLNVALNGVFNEYGKSIAECEENSSEPAAGFNGLSSLPIKIPKSESGLSETTSVMHSESLPGSSLKLRIRFQKPKIPRKRIRTKQTKKIKLNQSSTFATKCRDCDQIFATKVGFDAHVKKHQKEWGPADPDGVVCAVCGYRLSSKGFLRLHMKSVHLPKPAIDEHEQPEFSCNVCSAKFRCKSTITLHMHVHSEERNYVCEMCGYKTYNAHNLRSHRESHNPEKTFKCEIENCSAVYRTRNLLRNHVRRIHEKRISCFCDQCHKGFTDSFLLKRHYVVHTGAKDHLCTVCGRGFALRHHLTFHARKVHNLELGSLSAGQDVSTSDQKPSTSSIRETSCIKLTKSPPAKEFPCQICGKPFAKASQLRTHTTRMHKAKPSGCVATSQIDVLPNFAPTAATATAGSSGHVTNSGVVGQTPFYYAAPPGIFLQDGAVFDTHALQFMDMDYQYPA